jgi:DNA topoisomerase-1
MKLLIVESPTKAKTISKFLNNDFKIEASYGHVRDLPKSKLGVDIENNFNPQYVIPLKARKVVNHLKKVALESKEVILATDADREGEAIAWHLMNILNEAKNKGKINFSRIVFHEITTKAINEALKSPRDININLVNAQQARRILDRLVGYKLSPFLWKKVFRGLSAGRVQSVALRLIVERESEIENFKKEEYWTIEVLLKTEGGQEIKAFLFKIKNETIPKPGIKDKKIVEEILKNIQNDTFYVKNYEEKHTKRNPPPPFITSTLEQEANKILKFTAKQTMTLAQRLYENGFITYMRTDSLNLSEEALQNARNLILENYGKNYLTEKPIKFKNKSKLAQEAHEAIRPTNVYLLPSQINVEEKERKLYKLIWDRFIASQLPPAVFKTQLLEIKCGDYLFKANGLKLEFDGFLKIWKQDFEEKEIPVLQKGEALKLVKVEDKLHFTEPPPRYNEATLIKALELYGIGRPSTYATIISVIEERNYVKKDKNRRLIPTDVGKLVNKVLTEHFPEIVDINFTAQMEENLDKIALGEKDWIEVLKNFYEPFAKNLEEKYQSLEKQTKFFEEETNEICDKCGRKMIIKFSRFGKFLACSGFPECKNTKTFIKEENINLGECPKCNSGNIILRKTKKGKIFYGCSNYPDCDWSSWEKPQNKD